MAWTAPRTWVAGEAMTATLLNTHIRDNLLAFGGVWTTYTPTLTTTGTPPAIGNGTLTGRYARAGTTVGVALDFIAGSTTTFGTGGFRFSLPLASRLPASGTAAFGGWLYCEDLATTAYSFFPRLDSATTMHLVYDNASTSGALAAVVSQGAPHTWGAGDYIRGHFYYEAA